MSNTTYPAFVEFGDWMIACPNCGKHIYVDQVTDRAVCTRCYPSLLANAMQPIQGGLFRPVPDVLLREETRARAEVEGCMYQAAYPAERIQIEAVLRARPAKRNMNWYYEGHPTLIRLGRQFESVEDLINENSAYGVDMTNFVLPDLKG